MFSVTAHTGESEKKQNGDMFSITVHTSEKCKETERICLALQCTLVRVRRHRRDLFAVTAHTGESEKKQHGFAHSAHW